jgi:hypothetical protein
MVKRCGLREASKFLCKEVFEGHLTGIPGSWFPYCFWKLLVAHSAVSFLGFLGGAGDVWLFRWETS